MSARAVLVSACLALTAAGGCSVGDGSELEPTFRTPPADVFAGVVVDGQGRPIVAARVRVAPAGPATATGRSGRFHLEGAPKGEFLLEVDGRPATATGAERLPLLRVRVASAGGHVQWPHAFVLPDLAAGAGADLTIGTLPSPVTLDDSAGSGGRLDLAAGTAVSLTGRVSGTVRADLAGLGAADPPRPLPAPAGGARLAGKPLWIAPVDLSFGPGARLSAADDLGLPSGGKATLYRLDPALGTWSTVGAATESGGRLVQDAADLPGGGLYVFAVDVSEAAVVTGRVVRSDGKALAGASVLGPGGLAARADAAGAFRLAGVPARDGGGARPTLRFRLLAPLDQAPVTDTFTLAVGGAAVDAGKRSLATYGVGLVRFFVARRGRTLAHARVTIGGPQGFGRTVTAGADGKGSLYDVPAGRVSVRASFSEGRELLVGDADLFLSEGGRVDLPLLLGPRNLRPGELRGRMQARVLAERSGAPLEGAVVQGDADPGTSDKATAGVAGFAFLGGRRNGTATAAFQSTAAGGSTTTAALSLVVLDHSAPEFPLPVAARAPLGAFDPFAVLEGSLTGASLGGKAFRVLVHPRRPAYAFFDEVLGGGPPGPELPRFVDPQASGSPAFRLGLPPRLARVTGLAGSQSGGRFVPERLGLLLDLAPSAGTTIQRDLALALPFDHSLVLTGIQGLDAAFGASDLVWRLGARLPSGEGLTLVPESGGATLQGSDLVLPVPGRTGALAGAVWQVFVEAAGTETSGAEIRQRILTEAAGDRAPAPAFLAVPRITSPAQGQVLASAAAVDVRWTPPSGAGYQVVTLESMKGGDRLFWRAVLPGDRASHRFGALIPEAKNPLVAGRTYTLTVEAFRLSPESLLEGFGDAYQRLLGNQLSLGEGDRRVEAASRHRITFSLP